MMQHLIGLFMKSSADASVNKAKDSYIRALELNNKDVYALGILGFIYGDNKEYDKAEELFNKGLEIAPNNPLLYLALGQMFDRMKEYHFAINYYEIILEFTEEEVEKDFAHMNQYYHKLMEFYPDSLAKAKEEARKYLKEDYKKIGRESTL
jgi:tetratricopeptide (TPR) repeat protein